MKTIVPRLEVHIAGTPPGSTNATFKMTYFSTGSKQNVNLKDDFWGLADLLQGLVKQNQIKQRTGILAFLFYL